MSIKATVAAAFVVILVWPITVRAQAIQENGTYWKNFDGLQREVYISGYMHGMWSAYSPLTKGQAANYSEGLKRRHKLLRNDGSTPSVSEITTAVSEFYDQPENLPVCVANAIYYEWRSLAGHSLPPSWLVFMRGLDGKYGCQ